MEIAVWGPCSRWWGALTACALLTGPAGAFAQTATDSPGEPAPISRRELGTLLDGAPDQALTALRAIRGRTLTNFAPRIAAMLRRGQTDPVTDRALETLGALRTPAATDVLSEFTGHRRPSARRQAYRALAQTPGTQARRLLENGLRDSDRDVRGVAAAALGDLGNRASIEPLFAAFERGVVEAAAALGKLGNTTTLERYNQQLGTAPLPVMLSGYREYLRRRDIPSEAKRSIVVLLGEVSGEMVQRFLRAYLETLPRRRRHPLRSLVEDTLRRVVADPTQTTRPTRPARFGR